MYGPGPDRIAIVAVPLLFPKQLTLDTVAAAEIELLGAVVVNRGSTMAINPSQPGYEGAPDLTCTISVFVPACQLLHKLTLTPPENVNPELLYGLGLVDE